VLKFALGLERSEMDEVRGASSSEFSRLVWNYCRKTPDFDRNPVPHLKAPLREARVSGDRAVLILGDKRFGAEVTLRRENGQFRVDHETSLIFGAAKGQHVGLKRVIRAPLAEGHDLPEPGDIFNSSDEYQASRK
jgi:hypothetical protein